MDEQKYTYRCKVCDSISEKKSSENPPICCDVAMVLEPLEQCTTTGHAEMARNEDDSDVCDDGRGHQ